MSTDEAVRKCAGSIWARMWVDGPAGIEAIIRECLAGPLADAERFTFIVSVLNTWDLFCNFVNEYVPMRLTTCRRATWDEWRKAIDEARKA